MPAFAKNWQARIGGRLRLRDLHVLLAVAQSGSMAKAARELSVSQPAVSQAIAELEHTLGVRLLDRGSHGVEPTAYGRAVLARSRAVFDELGQAVKDIAFLSDPTAGELRLGCPESIVATFIPVIVEHFARRNPGVVLRVEQIHDVSPRFRELRERQVDFVLARPPRSFAADDLQVDVLLDEALVIAAGGGSSWTRRRKIALADLVDEPWVLPPPETGAGILARQLFEHHGLAPPDAGVLSLSTHLRCCLIGSGHFLGVLPASVLRFNGARFSLKRLPLDQRLDGNPVAIVRLKDRTLGPLVERFIASVRETLKGV